MLLIVAKDSPMDAASRIITLGRKVFSCRRFITEDNDTFAECFRGVAQDHMNCSRHSPTDHEKQQTALIMLENSALPETVSNNLLSWLVEKKDQSEQSKSKNLGTRPI